MRRSPTRSTNLLALADGQIARTLPTVPGTTYTLSFAYRGPEIVGFWRGESNAVDSIYGNSGTIVNTAFSNGVVGLAFANDPENIPGYNGVEVPDQSAYVLTNSMSIEGWIRPRGDGYTIFWRGDQTSGYDPYVVSMQGNHDIRWAVTDAGNNLASVGANIAYDQWWHVAATLDGGSGEMQFYLNGELVDRTNTTIRPFGTLAGANPGVGIGNVNDGFNNFPFIGDIDEISLYGRALSASEIKAIYNLGTNVTKFATNAPSIATGLAEAQVVLNGTNQPIFFGNNTNWQTITYSFIATETNTPLQINGLEPGMLLDNFVMTTVPTNDFDLFYQPEQSLETVKGENAYGRWQLEVQDNRVGATNPAPSLMSWQLRFNFPFTPPTITTLTNTQVITNNLIPPGGIEYFLVIVPTNADISTNILLNTDGTLNLIFDQPNPPTGFSAAGLFDPQALAPGVIGHIDHR